MVSLAKGKAAGSGFKYMLEFPSCFRVYTNDDVLVSKMLAQCNTSKPPGVQAAESRNERFIGRLGSRHLGKAFAYEIYEDDRRFRVVSSRSNDKALGAVVKKSTVEKVYSYLRKDGKKRSAHNIENALGISITTVLNSLKILRVQRRAKLVLFGKNNKAQFRAL
jgi:hypothetical protein